MLFDDPKFNEQEPKDIFDGIGEAAPSGVPQPPKAVSLEGTKPEPPMPPGSKISSGISKKIFIIGIAVILIAALGAGAYFLLRTRKVPVQEILTPEQTQEILPTKTTETETPVQVETPQEQAVTPDNLDSDKDGLSDKEENTLGTDPFLADSDDDGLLDFEEVNTYKTDPLNPDSDKDGFLDGDEVANGYNPLGSGKLMDLKDEINKINGQQ